MFTGIITDIGRVRAVEAEGGDRRFVIAAGFDMEAILIGASIACSGICLTVVERGVEKGSEAAGGWFAADVSGETLTRTTAADWREGRRINLERSLKLGDELGGHLVYGHVDGIAHIVERREEGESSRFVFEAPAEFARYLAPKGSVTLDGVALTINEVEGRRFGINVIGHTLRCTTLGGAAPEDKVNIEVDAIARYVAHLLEQR
jgi:riboflavin synthase